MQLHFGTPMPFEWGRPSHWFGAVSQTHHIINADTLARAKRGALLVNTSRGGLVDTEAAIDALKSRQLGGLAIDVYEQEADLFFAISPAPLSPTTCSSAWSPFQTSS